jgi:peptide/nickel transport system substrate-binding protein
MTIHSKSIWKPALIVLMLGGILLSACSSIPALSPATATPTTTPTPTAVPLKTLVVCLGDEPTSLYLYGNASQSMWSVLESLYDGPFDTVNYQPQAVIMEEVPTQENGDVTLQSASVSAGDLVANTEGDPVALAKGVTVFPEGCTSADCAVTWDGESELKLSQMVVHFKIKSGVTWSDGQPLTADDSVYSYEVAADTSTTASKSLVQRTASYAAQDAQTTVWTGIPGYLTLNPSAFFWTPLPKHQLSQYAIKDLATTDAATKDPLGWGPYKIDEWVSGDHIRMVKNSNYFRASEGLPNFDVIDYRFLGNVPQADLSPILTGECDIIDTSVSLSDQVSSIRSLELQNKLKGYYAQGPEWMGINFGIKPSSYDDIFNPYLDRADFFGDARTRQAVADCIDRDTIVHSLIFSLGDVPDTYLPANHPYYVSGLTAYPFDQAAGEALLDQVGWKDTDGDPSTPRVAVGIPTVPEGTPFAITLTASTSQLNTYIADEMTKDLGKCGVQLSTNLVQEGDLYAAGPDGVAFGRNFDLALLGWTSGRQNPCFLYETSEIPSAANDWLGTKFGGVNLTGYSNSEYDTACQAYLTAGLDQEAATTANQQAMTILANDLPVIPLYYQVKVMVSRPDLCGLTLDASSRSGLKDIEKLDISSSCSQ